MKLVSKIAAAALIAAAVPAASRADDRRGPPVSVPAPVPPDPRDFVRPGDGWRGGDRDFRQDHHRDAREHWRAREIREVHAALRALELERHRFHHSGWHRPREVRRFERWYAYRRAELERRRESLQAYAWR